MVVLVCSAALLAWTAVRGHDTPQDVGVVVVGSEWDRTLQVVANLRARTPGQPVVVLFGGSAARESVESEEIWQAQVRRDAEIPVLCYNLATNIQSYADDVGLVRALPSRGRFLVFIGVNPGRYCQPPGTPTVPLPEPSPINTPPTTHRYDERKPKSPGAKRQLAEEWLRERYPVFRRWFAYNARQLDRLVGVCLARGYQPVVLDLPFDSTSAGRALAVPVRESRQNARAVARAHGIPWVSLRRSARLAGSDFHDLWHLRGGPGRSRWQRLLSQCSSDLLRASGWSAPEPHSSAAE